MYSRREGEKVIILESAINAGVSQSAVGKSGTIENVYSETNISVHMDNDPNSECWWMECKDVKPAVVKGQQLVFPFAEEK